MSCWCLGDFRSQALLHVAVPVEADWDHPVHGSGVQYPRLAGESWAAEAAEVLADRGVPVRSCHCPIKQGPPTPSLSPQPARGGEEKNPNAFLLPFGAFLADLLFPEVSQI